MPRVLFLTSAYPDAHRPGMGNFVEQQLRALAERPDMEVEVVAPLGLPPFPLSMRPRHRAERAIPREEIWNGIRVHRPRFTLFPLRGARRADAVARAALPILRRIRRRFAFDLIHAEFFWPDGVAAMRLAEALDTAFTIKARGGDFEHPARRPSTAPLVLEAGARAAGLLAVSESLRDSMVACGLPAGRILVHRTGVDRKVFAPRDQAAAKASLKVEGPLLLSVGNLVPRKRQHLALEALVRLDDATLIVIGGGPERDRLDELVGRLGLEGRVRMMGRLPQPLLPFFYAAADVTVHTASLEGLANVWVESLACGTPVVTTDCGGAREAVDRDEAGRVVAADPAAIAGAVRDILARPPDSAAVARAADRFDWDRNAAELDAFVRDALARGGLSPA